MAVSLKQGERWTEMFLCLFSNLTMENVKVVGKENGMNIENHQLTTGKRIL